MGTQGINARIVPRGTEFPANRTARCCRRMVRAGESVLIVPVTSGDLVVRVVFHRNCLSKMVEEMPLGAEEARSAFDKLRERIITSGKAFPD